MAFITDDGIIFSKNDVREIENKLQTKLCTYWKLDVSPNSVMVGILRYDEVNYSVPENYSNSFNSAFELTTLIDIDELIQMQFIRLNVQIYFEPGLYSQGFNSNDQFHVVDLKINQIS